LNERQRMNRYGRPINKKGAQAEALKLGFKSMAEVELFQHQQDVGYGILYEPMKIQYVLKKMYTPDFQVFKEDGTFFYAEMKGYLRPADRTKMCAVKEQYPDLDLRFIFINANTTITKRSKTTYGMWATKQGFMWAEKTIPDEWLWTDERGDNNARVQ